MLIGEIIRGLLAGVIAGLASGFLGVSPGGILVPVISLLLPFSQHVAQGLSLIVQAPPTSASGLAAYSRKRQWPAFVPIMLISGGFIIGGPIGALIAKVCSERELRWMYVGYLLILTALSALKSSRRRVSASGPEHVKPCLYVVLVCIGIIAGISSGLLGIGGGLAITALCVVLLHRDRHEANALSLAITAMPLTLPAAWVYVRHGWHLPWEIIGCLVVGLALGAWTGAVFANRLTERTLKAAFTTLLIAMTVYMTVIASRT
ncbi:MAG TPA: sulfite exporter TauE/SafE family protein [Acidobacteriaceae bacterium]|nr:sulfite exporter TauE/SafE family protein [Acidobacteriaceae bacterium]